MRRAGRKLIPEPIQIDTFAPGHEALHVGAAETEVPKQRILENLFPGADPQGLSASIITSRVVRSWCASANANATMLPMSWPTTSAPDVQGTHDTRDVFGLVFFVKPLLAVAESHAAQVRRDDRMVTHEIRRQRRHMSPVSP